MGQGFSIEDLHGAGHSGESMAQSVHSSAYGSANVGGPKGPTGSVLMPTPASTQTRSYSPKTTKTIPSTNPLSQYQAGIKEVVPSAEVNKAHGAEFGHPLGSVSLGNSQSDMTAFDASVKSGGTTTAGNMPGSLTRAVNPRNDSDISAKEESVTERPTGGSPVAGPATAAFQKGASKYASSYGRGASGGTGKEEDN